MSDLPKRLLNGFAVLVALGVVALIGLGGLVTSHDAGMAVPDWPNSFGYNMFLFPISRWVGGVFFEHTHRLAASVVGLLTIALFVLTLVIEDRRWVKWLSGIALLAVIIQGILGGLRVTEANPLLGLFHGCLAQAYLAIVATIALVTTRFWRRLAPAADLLSQRRSRFWSIFVTGMVFLQLVLGASMRHAHTDLSIPDFPTVYGGFVPPMDAGSIAQINAARAAMSPPLAPTSAHLIGLQYLHRVWAVLIVIGIFVVAGRLLRNPQMPFQLRFGACFWICLVIGQFCLGVWTVWSNKAADVATTHQVCGALTLTTGVLLSVVLSAMLGRSSLPGSTENANSMEVMGR
jgi:cytochrome c oxidase assembly protein subunit 15